MSSSPLLRVLLPRADAQSLHVHIHLMNWYPERSLDTELDVLHDVVRDFGDTDSVLENDKQVDDDALLDDANLHSTPNALALKDLKPAAERWMCHANHAIAFQYGVPCQARYRSR